MSEKQFVEIDDGLDFSIKHIESGEMFYDCESVVDILNELAEENEQLKQQLKTKHIVNKQYEELQRLKKDNKELKKENKKLEEEWEFSFRTEMAHHRFAEKELKEKIREKQAKIKELEKVNEDLREVNKENQRLHEENVKQCERWRSLYELKDSEVTARVDTLNRVCNYYLTESRFKGDTDPNDAVKEVINEILNAPIYEE